MEIKDLLGPLVHQDRRENQEKQALMELQERTALMD